MSKIKLLKKIYTSIAKCVLELIIILLVGCFFVWAFDLIGDEFGQLVAFSSSMIAVSAVRELLKDKEGK